MQTRQFFLSGFLAAVSLLNVVSTQAQAAGKTSCVDAVHEANQTLEEQNGKPIRNEAALVSLLRALNKDEVLPANYVTSEYAIRQGWSGKATDSLWKVWVLNQKSIGGDVVQSAGLAGGGTWYSADLESVRGLRSAKRVIYSPQSATRYLTSNENSSRVEIAPCF